MSSLSWAPRRLLHSLPGPLSPRGSFFCGFPASYLGLYLPCFWHALPATTTPVLAPSGGKMERNKGAGGSPTFWRPLFLRSKGASSPPLRGWGVCGSLYSGHPFLTPPACSRGFLLKCHPHWCPFLSLQLPWVRLADTKGNKKDALTANSVAPQILVFLSQSSCCYSLSSPQVPLRIPSRFCDCSILPGARTCKVLFKNQIQNKKKKKIKARPT